MTFSSDRQRKAVMAKLGSRRQALHRPAKKPSFDVTSRIIDYEEGNLDDKQTIELFQHLENTGMAYRLQGHYGRVATSLIGAGLIKPNMNIHSEEDIKKFRQQQNINKAFSDL